jgi:hypothetical protein
VARQYTGSAEDHELPDRRLRYALHEGGHDGGVGGISGRASI